MAIVIRNFRPRSVFMNFGAMQKPVQFIAESPIESAGVPVMKAPGFWERWMPSRRVSSVVLRPALTVALTQEALGIDEGGGMLADGIGNFTDEEFVQYVELLREVSADAVPRMNALGDIPEREACVEDMPSDTPLKHTRARIVWMPNPRVALYYMTGFGDAFYDWAKSYHPNTNLPAACKALYADVVVIIPRVCRMTPDLYRALLAARGRRYRY